MPGPWQSILAAQPADGQTVWVRRLYFDDPTEAVYSQANTRFQIGPKVVAMSDFVTATPPLILTQSGTLNGAILYSNPLPYFLYWAPSDATWALAPTAGLDGGSEDYSMYWVNGATPDPTGDPTDIQGRWNTVAATGPAGYTYDATLYLPWSGVDRWATYP